MKVAIMKAPYHVFFNMKTALERAHLELLL